MSEAAEAEAEGALQRARARHDALFSQPPRMSPLDAAVIGEEELVGFANRLRRAALGEAATPMTLEEIPEMVPTLFRHQALWERFAAVSIELLGRGALNPRDRELVVLRVGWLLQAPFEFGEHVKQAKLAGVTDEEVERAVVGSGASGWNDYDRALMCAAEELHADAMICDATWTTLAQRLNDKQLFELTVLIGQFTAVAYFQNALRLRLPKGNQGLEAR